MTTRAAALAILIILSAGCLQRPPPGVVEVKLGAILPAEDVAMRGVWEGFDLAVRQVNAARSDFRIHVLTESATGGDAAGAFDRLVASGALAVVDLRGPADAQALASRAEDARRVLLLPAVANASGGSTHVLSLAADPVAEGGALVALATRSGASSLVVLYEASAYGSRIAQAVAARTNASLVAYAPGVAGGAHDAGRALCDAAPEAVVLVAYPNDALRALEGLAPCRAGMGVLASSSVAGLDVTAAETETVRGIVGVSPATAQPLVFSSLYRNLHQTAPKPFTAEAFDAVLYFALAAAAASPVPTAQNEAQPPVTPEAIARHLPLVASPPGVRHVDFDRAVGAAREGDDIEWVGYAHAQGGGASETFIEWRVGDDLRITYDASRPLDAAN